MDPLPGHGPADQPPLKLRRSAEALAKAEAGRYGHGPGAARLATAVVVSIVFVLSAPFFGQIRSALKAAFPRQFVAIVGILVATMVVAAVSTALLRIRERRAFRYGALLTALVCAVVYSRWQASGRSDVDVVELFHFVEYGVITLLFYRAWRPIDDGSILILPVLAGIIVSTVDEWLQWFVPARVGEMKDVLLNGAAIGCGLLFSLGIDPPARLSTRLRPRSLARLGRVAAGAILAFAVFFHVVHMGDVVSDSEIGSFTSRYSRDALERLDVEKRIEWQRRPLPLVLHRVSREDQFMTEGVVHVQERNEQWAAGHFLEAWYENRILEKYFGAVLDAPSYVSRSGYRWPAEQRADAAARAGAALGGDQAPPRASSSYVSQAYPYPIYPWSKPTFWAIISAVVGLTLVLSSRLDLFG